MEKLEATMDISLIKLADIKAEQRHLINIINLRESAFKEQTKKFRMQADNCINPLLKQIDELNVKYNILFKLICDNAIFEDDKFLKAAKVKGDSYKEGKYRIIRHIKTKRTLNQSAFKKDYPVEFKQYGTIDLGKADNAIGKDKVNALCAIKDEYTFEFYDPDEKTEK